MDKAFPEWPQQAAFVEKNDFFLILMKTHIFLAFRYDI